MYHNGMSGSTGPPRIDYVSATPPNKNRDYIQLGGGWSDLEKCFDSLETISTQKPTLALTRKGIIMGDVSDNHGYAFRVHQKRPEFIKNKNGECKYEKIAYKSEIHELREKIAALEKMIETLWYTPPNIGGPGYEEVFSRNKSKFCEGSNTQ